MGGWRQLPAEFRAGRIFMRPRTWAGKSLLLYTDSGGGTSFLWERSANAHRLGLAPVQVDGRDVIVTTMPDFHPDAWVPTVPQLFAMRPEAVQRQWAEVLANADGFLGQDWYGDRIWLLDYAQGRAHIWEGEGSPEPPSEALPLHFAVDRHGRRPQSFARMEAQIDGETLNFLFDTGATIVATDRARAAMGGPAVQGASFVVRSLLDRWRARHPEWQVVDDADMVIGGPAIAVPEVCIGRTGLGPVWFTARRDESFHRWMSQWMDAQIDGALGGSTFRSCRVIVDYPHAVAYVMPQTNIRVQSGVGD